MSLENLVIRPIQEQDLETLCHVAKIVGPGFTSIPDHPEFLKNKIEKACQSFKGQLKPQAALYLFILEDVENHHFAGLCGVEAMVGYGVAFYNYKISTITQVCAALNKYMEHEIFQLVNDFQEASELVSLFLHPDYRGQKRGELLSRSRFLFIAQFPHLFSDVIIAELRGVSDPAGNSPFWEAAGRPFFDMDFLEADYLTSVSGKQFISDLVPRHPIFLDLLPKAAREVVGKPHVQTARAKQMLENEGLTYQGYIDIFDGGPLISANMQQIHSIAKSQTAEIASVKSRVSSGVQAMVCNDRMDFRLTVGKVALDENGNAHISSKTAQNLNVSEGDAIRFILF